MKARRAERLRRVGLVSVACVVVVALVLAVTLSLEGAGPETKRLEVAGEQPWRVADISHDTTWGWCVDIEVGSTAAHGCVDGRSVAVWRVQGRDFALFLDQAAEEPKLEIHEWSSFAVTHPQHVPSCLGGPLIEPGPPEELRASRPSGVLGAIAPLVAVRFGEVAPPLEHFGCGAGWLAAGVSDADQRSRTREIWFLEHDGRWETGPIIDYSLPREVRCAVLPSESTGGGVPMSPREACLLKG
jgi:hypothetical protein